MNKDEKRSGYTKRMMEIMSSIKKQRAGIDKVGGRSVYRADGSVSENLR